MKVKVIRSFIDKNTMEDVDKGMEIEITQERFLELTEGPRGIFVKEVEEVKKEPKEDTKEIPPEKKEENKLEDSIEESKKDIKKKSAKK